ncbi:hypothetical protein L6164_018151 [Bauhinia variegata]|uniref:Uncharacterized protein n=1 Tax=Bauhinia variegata TaxID=167791 RepID=A0ACB9NAD7_BAUVA|nr:hypothetical protein L6164_018151 [Bauhinia variegata]
MASFFTIPKALLLLHLLLLFLSSPFIKHIAADSQLIQKECNKSDTPETCLNCVNSDPGSQKADSLGIAAIVLNCISNHAETMDAGIRSLRSKTEDRQLRRFCLQCEEGYKTVKGDIASAKQDLKTHNFDMASIAVSLSAALNTACLIRIAAYKGEVPSEIMNEFKVFEELSKAADKIIEGLK